MPARASQRQSVKTAKAVAKCAVRLFMGVAEAFPGVVSTFAEAGKDQNGQVASSVSDGIRDKNDPFPENGDFEVV